MTNKEFRALLRGVRAPGVWRALEPGRPVRIADLGAAAGLDPAIPRRALQMHLGGVLSRLNRRLAECGIPKRIAPGEPRGTYCLRPIER